MNFGSPREDFQTLIVYTAEGYVDSNGMNGCVPW